MQIRKLRSTQNFRMNCNLIEQKTRISLVLYAVLSFQVEQIMAVAKHTAVGWRLGGEPSPLCDNVP